MDNSGGRPEGVMADRLVYSLREAAELLGVHYETAARWVRSGRLRGHRVSHRKVIVPKESLEAFLKGGRAVEETAGDLPFGSPKKWLALVGTLTPEEGASIRASLKDLETLDEEP
jgi:excisionase family DNA binding protein